MSRSRRQLLIEEYGNEPYINYSNHNYNITNSTNFIPSSCSYSSSGDNTIANASSSDDNGDNAGNIDGDSTRDGNSCMADDKAAFRIAMINMKLTLIDGNPINIPIPQYSHLYLGSVGCAYSLKSLLNHHITHVICVCNRVRLKYPDRFQYLRVPLEDESNEDLLSMLPTVFEFFSLARNSDNTSGIDAANPVMTSDSAIEIASESGVSIRRPSNILVHCYQGKSRSVAICCAIMMKYFGYSLDDALRCIRSVRPSACPNPGFIQCLRVFERRLQSEA